VNLARQPAACVGTIRHRSGALASQTRAPVSGIVAPEGGGTSSPTLGGGIVVTRARVNLEASSR
jgi:hypothetical protein